MNKNLKEVNVRREYNGQVWYEVEQVEPTWTVEFLEQWVKDRRAGIQTTAETKEYIQPETSSLVTLARNSTHHHFDGTEKTRVFPWTDAPWAVTYIK